MKPCLGGRPFEMKFVFVLAVTLLLPGVTSRTLVSMATTPPDVTSGPMIGDREKEPILDTTEAEPSSEEEDFTELDGTLEDDEIEAVAESPEVNNGTETNNEDDEDREDEALALLSLIAKRAADEDDTKEGETETDSVDEDKFSISDLPKLFKPLIDAFSDTSSSEAPLKDDFLSWFPGLKDLFKPSKPSGTEATSSATRSGRRSSFPTPPEPSLRTPPVSTTQPPEVESFPSSQPYNLIATDPTITRSPTTIPNPRVTISKGPVTDDPPNNSHSYGK